MFEDMVKIDIMKMIVSHLHGSIIDLIFVVKIFEMVRPITRR